MMSIYRRWKQYASDLISHLAATYPIRALMAALSREDGQGHIKQGPAEVIELDDLLPEEPIRPYRDNRESRSRRHRGNATRQ